MHIYFDSTFPFLGTCPGETFLDPYREHQKKEHRNIVLIPGWFKNIYQLRKHSSSALTNELIQNLENNLSDCQWEK